MTPAQEEAVNQIHKLAVEYFDSYVFVARTGDETGKGDSYRYRSHGSGAEQLGLVRIFNLKIEAGYTETQEEDMS